MVTKMKKMTLFSIAMLMVIMVAAGSISGGVKAGASDAVPVSSGLRVIASQSAMGKYGVSGGEIAFSPEDFERALNSARVDYITLTEIPSGSMGTLRLGSEAVSVGQSVSRENIHKLSYVPSGEGICEDSFTFTTGKGYDIECGLFMLDGENYAPVAGIDGELSLEVSTHRNVSVFGSLSGHDNDGDEIRFEIVSYPEKGLLTLTDTKNGEFKYTPKAEYTGSDSFRYVVVDKYGNYSAASTVTLTVNKVKLDSVLTDMGGNRAHTSAITMVERGIMSVKTSSDGSLEFSPFEKVTREDFLVMTMKAVGINAPDPTDSGFADDGDISAAARGYVALARQKGYVKGTQVGEEYFFYPNNTVTAAEAAVIIDSIINGSKYVVNENGALSVFADHEDIPAWAEESVLTLKQAGVISVGGGYFYPERELTRENAALMLEAVIRLMENE